MRLERKIIKEINIVAEEFDKRRKDLLKKYAEPVEGKEGEYSFENNPEGKDEYIKKIEVALEDEVDISFPKIKIDELKDVKLVAGQLDTIEWFLEE